MLKRWIIFVYIVAMVFVLGGCAAPKAAHEQPETVVERESESAAEEAPDDFDATFDDDWDNWDEPTRLIADPFEPINRGTFWVNDKLYFYFFKPLARGYRVVVPQPARVSVKNFFSNLSTPVRAGNALLQLRFTDVGTETYRFIVNSSIGLAGLFDPATSVGEVPKTSADFGQTLGVYGFGQGFYLVLPVVGPSSLRDGVGTFVDSYAEPLNIVDVKTVEKFLVRIFDATNRLSLDRDTYEGIIRDSLDPYLFIRNAYAQRRQAQIGDGVVNLNIFSAPIFYQDAANPFEWFRLD